MDVIAERGYLIPAIDSEGTAYVECAQRLADSIKKFHPEANVTIMTEDMLPYGDLGGFANDWQVLVVSPYRQTIKLEADMLIVSPIDHWWTMFEHRDVVISTGCRDIYDQSSTNRFYRKIFELNSLPDVYNAITYWRRSAVATEFFELVRNIFRHWDQCRTLLKFPEQNPSTDVVYAMAASIMGVEKVTLPKGYGPSIVHMKQHILPTHTSDWTRELVWETDPLRIATVAQWGAVHYYIKDWDHGRDN